MALGLPQPRVRRHRTRDVAYARRAGLPASATTLAVAGTQSRAIGLRRYGPTLPAFMTDLPRLSIPD